MRIHQVSLKCAMVLLLSALWGGIACAVIELSESIRAGDAKAGIPRVSAAEALRASTCPTIDSMNPNPPSTTVKLVFIHQSTGANWLHRNFGGMIYEMNNNHYYVSDAHRNTAGDPYDIATRTDIGDWYEWFAGPNSEEITDWLYDLDNTRYNTIPNPDNDLENEIIMFKSCFPNSNIWGNPDDPHNDDPAPPRGFAPNSPDHNVANIKRIYVDALEYFETRQDKLFIVITAPPLLMDDTDETRATNARAINNWLVYEWLDDYPYHNVAVFDFFGVLTTNGGDANTNDLGWSTGNHHRLITTTAPITIQHKTDGDDDTDLNVLEYPTQSGTDNHPSVAGYHKATGEFIPLLNAYYNCWKHGACWNNTANWISITAIPDTASVYPGEATTYTVSAAASEDVTNSLPLDLQGAPPDAVASFAPNPITPPGTSQLYITTATSTPAGTYAMTVTSTSDQLTDTVSLTLSVEPAPISPTFSLIAQPSTDSIIPGDATAYMITVSASEGFTIPVTLTLQRSPSDATISFAPNPITPSFTSQLYITTATSTPAGTYAMTVTGVSDQLTDTVSLTLTIETLSLSTQPAARSILPGDRAVFTLSVMVDEDFADPVTLTLENAPSETIASFVPNPVTPPNTSQLYVTTTTSITDGIHTMTAIATSGVLTDTANVTLIVASAAPSFTLDLSPTVRTAKPGHVISYTASVAGLNGFSQPVSLTVVGLPTDVGAGWNTNPIMPDNASILSLSIPGEPSFGDHPLYVVGTAETQTVVEEINLTIDYPYNIYLPVILRRTRLSVHPR